MLVGIVKDYTLLQVAKLHDSIQSGRYKNHTVKYVIECIPDNKRQLDAYDDFCKKKECFIAPIKQARSKIIARNDISAIENNELLGYFPKNAEIDYFDHLRQFMDFLYNHVGIGAFPDWPTFIENDIQDFVGILIDIKKCEQYEHD